MKNPREPLSGTPVRNLREEPLLTTHWLSFHASYACRHSGACCSSGWDIPIERSRVTAVAETIARGAIHAPARWYREVDEAPEDVAGVLAVAPDRRCVFHQSPGCAVHSALGHAAIPSACQHFPRIALIDRRGVFVTLSHYCPTAAGLLFESRKPASVVVGSPAIPGVDLPEGLDARDSLPPSRSPSLLMTWEDYDRWERDAIALLTSGVVAEQAIASLDPRALDFDANALHHAVRHSVPAPHQWPVFDGTLASEDPRLTPVVGRFLAAHLFGSWMAYQGSGLLATILYVRTALVVLNAERARTSSAVDAIRQSDLLLRHLVEPQELAMRLSRLAKRYS